MKYASNTKSQAQGWFLHRITGTFLVFLLLTHFWIQHFDATTRSVVEQVVTHADADDGINAEGNEVQPLPTYGEPAVRAVEARRQTDPRFGAPGSPVTPYEVTMLRLADPVYAVLWKAFNLVFLLFALHHGFYGLTNILTDYIRRPMNRAIATALSWIVALVLLVIGSYSVVTAGTNMTVPAPGTPTLNEALPTASPATPGAVTTPMTAPAGSPVAAPAAPPAASPAPVGTPPDSVWR